MFASAGETPIRLSIPGVGDAGATVIDNVRTSFVTANFFPCWASILHSGAFSLKTKIAIQRQVRSPACCHPQLFVLGAAIRPRFQRS